MVRLAVRFYGVVGTSDRWVEGILECSENTTLHDALRTFFQRNGLFQRNKLEIVEKEYSLVLNGKGLSMDAARSTYVSDGDEISVILPVVGGRG